MNKSSQRRVSNPFLDLSPATALRDPAILQHDGSVYCFFSEVERTDNGMFWYVSYSKSSDLMHWSFPKRITPQSDLNFSSPGNVFSVNGMWYLCCQSYVREDDKYGSESCRLWLLASRDLQQWSSPKPMKPEGCTADWTESRRQIDPFVVHCNDRFWCFYKTSGALGLLVSNDIQGWREASPGCPVLSKCDMPDGATVENPCVITRDGEFVMFFAPCRKSRGIATARSNDLLHWKDIRYLDFPALNWAPGGATAPAVVDMPDEPGSWLMVFHGDAKHDGLHAEAKLGLAWSDDLEHWYINKV